MPVVSLTQAPGTRAQEPGRRAAQREERESCARSLAGVSSQRSWSQKGSGLRVSFLVMVRAQPRGPVSVCSWVAGHATTSTCCPRMLRLTAYVNSQESGQQLPCCSLRWPVSLGWTLAGSSAAHTSTRALPVICQPLPMIADLPFFGPGSGKSQVKVHLPHPAQPQPTVVSDTPEA